MYSATTISKDFPWNSFQKLFASVADSQTRNNHARHLALTKNILYENEEGWKVAELPLVSDLLRLLRNKVQDGVPQFSEQLVLAIMRCCKPFIRQKSNEEVTNPSLFYELLPTLGELLSLGAIDVQVAAAEALRIFATALARKPRSNNADAKSDDLRLTPRIFSQTLLEETGTVETIVTVMHDLFPDDEVGEKGDDQFPQETEKDPEMDDECMSTATQYPSTRQDEEITSNVDVDVEDLEIVEIPPGNNQVQLPRRTLSAPPNGTSTVHSSKPGSAPIQRVSNNVGDSIADGTYTEEIVSLDDPATPDQPAQNGGDTSRPASATDNVMSSNAGEEVEEEVVQVNGSTLPIHMRLSALLFPLIDLLYELSSYQRCAEVLVVSGTLYYIVFVLQNITNPQDELLPLCLEILWNVLDMSQEKMATINKVNSRKELLEVFRLRNATFFLGNEFTFQALLHVLEMLLAQGYRQQDKEMRNECLMILHVLAKRRRSLDFFYSTGLTACLFSYATSAELSHVKDKSSATASAITASNQYYTTTSDEDFEFKQMLWFLLAEISYDHEANLSELAQFRFLDVWLSYVTAGSQKSGSSRKYSAPQLQILQWTALSALNHVTPFVVDHFYDIGGHEKLLKFLELNVGNEDFLASTWLLMLQISPPLPYFQAELGKLGAIETAVDIFEASPSRNTFAIRRNAILACASMCRNDDGSNRRRFRQANGVHILINYLEFDPSHSVLEENILIGIIDAVRSCVIGDHESETAFINDDGVSKLLSILESASKALQHQTLAALAEICVNPAAIPSYQMWRSDQPGVNTNASANQVLLRLFADEEAAEKRSNQESTRDSKTPLVVSTNVRHSAFQSITTCRNPFIVASESSDLAESTSRPQSPAFARLKDALKAAQGFSPGTQTTNSILQLKMGQTHPAVDMKAKIYSVLANVAFTGELENLAPQDQVMLEIAKEYPTFQLGEMWQNVERALYAEGIRPIYADALYIRKNIEHAYDISVCTKLAQQEIFTNSRLQNTQREDAFFEQILRQKHQEAQAEQFHRANRRQNSTMQLHLDAKKTRLEFMRRQDPAAFAAYESEERCLIRDPPPDYVDEQEGLRTLQQNEAELRGRLSTITKSRKHTI
ncbi:Cilia- and flagella-associated protein 69 [Phytophthora citrophthora]|uniref:Cilia- and flagella-associated protein 69 n=1 Tax=Phytophthora citrophthora TaxID=4793 RepID=A0AAD9LPF6_9STRA|nr:Cilia- and flagella-associated protein 69 [Phytophthora citrophthora]